MAAMKVLCTNGMKSVLVDLLPEFERSTGNKVAITWGSANALMKELEEGAGGDLVVLTTQAVDELIARGKAVAQSRVDLARSGIGIAVRKSARKPDIGSPDALKHALMAAKSVAHSKTGTSGIYFLTVLARLGIAEAMQGKIVIPDAGTPVGEVVASGAAELGVQQLSELLPVAGVEVVGPLPEPLQKITTFTAAVLAGAKEPDAAKSLLEFIAARARPLLASKGLEPA
jgi:molybdate transport system substrate-binding protein